ncbi:MAG: hypothetical protein WD934_08910 [Gemmatimonadales bacterium]
MVQHDTPSAPDRTAALIAAMMLRFAEQDIAATLTPHEGVPPYVVLPDGPRLGEVDLVDWLERAPKPLFAVPTYIRRMIAAWPAFSGAQLTHDLANQQGILAEFQRTNQLTESETIQLDTGIESVSFPLSHLKVWAATYVASIGWTLKPPHDGRAAQVILTIPGRRYSPEWPSGVRPHA